MANYFSQYAENLSQIMAAVPFESVNGGLEMLWEVYRRDGTVFIIGNGGSASTASHMACDLGKNTVSEGHRRLRVTSLTDNVAHFSALGNDLGYESVFVEQLRNLLRAGDLLIGISASGNSPNLVRAFEFARSQNARTLALVGFDGGALKQKADLAVHVASDEYGPVEDMHLILNHAWVVEFRRRILEARLA